MNKIIGSLSKYTSTVASLFSRFGSEPFYLDVPFKYKDRAKTAGAKWDAKKKSWRTDTSGFATNKLLKIFNLNAKYHTQNEMRVAYELIDCTYVM